MKKQPIPDNMLTPPMLIGHISRAQRCTLRARENDPIMTQNSCRAILFCLAREEGVTQLELSHRAGLKPPTVSVTLQKMERDGLVTRRDNEIDLRQTLVFLTDKGKKIHEQIHGLHKEGDAIALSGLSEEEIDTLSSLLNRVIDNLLEELT